MDMQHVKTQIAQIIDQRRPMVKRIERIEAQMNELSSLLTETDRYRQQTAEKLTPEQNDRLGSLHGTEIIGETSVIRQELQQLKARFSRNTLNIGVVGLARQGKSRLLQSLTGLTKAEIPDSSGGHCTGVRSAILHKSDIIPYADVFFYTETEFLQQVIKPYFDELNLGAAPVTLEQFAAFDLSSSPQGAEIGEKYRHLKKYYDHLDLYRSFLFEPSPRRIQRSQIPEFVAQYALDEPETFYYNYLAVKEVHIYCPFQNESVGQIAVVDMPGLGDTGIGDEKRLIHSLGQDVDLVLFVRMPKAAGDDWMSFDVQLYDTANQGLREIPIDQWSFQVLNRLSDDSNAANCQRFSRSMPAQMKVTDVFVADCSDLTQANNLILVPMLEYMASQITELDQRFALSKQARLDKLRQDVRRFLDEANNALGIKGKAMDGSDFKLFRPLMNTFWTGITTQISGLTRELRKESDKGRDENFMRGLTLAIQQAKHSSGIPSLDEISILKDDKGGEWSDAYIYLLKIVRTHLTSHFQSLDADLAATVESAKNRIVVALRDAGLANLSPAKDSQFLCDITRMMQDDPALKTIYNGFNELANFKLVYRGFVQHRIRKHLNCLMADDPDARDFETNAEGILEKLNLLHARCLSRIQESLEELCWEPSTAVFAVIEEFQDRILRAEEVQHNDWEYFMEQHRSEIWPEKFGWRALLKKLDSLVMPNNFNLLASL